MISHPPAKLFVSWVEFTFFLLLARSDHRQRLYTSIITHISTLPKKTVEKVRRIGNKDEISILLQPIRIDLVLAFVDGRKTVSIWFDVICQAIKSS